VYELPLASFGAIQGSSIAADGKDDLYFAGGGQQGFLLVKFDAQGHLLATASDPAILAGALQLDPSGDPQVLTTTGTVRRYSTDLCAILFDTAINGLVDGMIIASEGGTLLFTATTSTNLPLLHPTAACDLPSGP